MVAFTICRIRSAIDIPHLIVGRQVCAHHVDLDVCRHRLIRRRTRLHLGDQVDRSGLLVLVRCIFPHQPLSYKRQQTFAIDVSKQPGDR